MSDTQVIIVVCIIALVQGVMLFYFMEKCVKQKNQLKSLRLFLILRCGDLIERSPKEVNQAIEDIFNQSHISSNHIEGVEAKGVIIDDPLRPSDQAIEDILKDS